MTTNSTTETEARPMDALEEYAVRMTLRSLDRKRLAESIERAQTIADDPTEKSSAVEFAAGVLDIAESMYLIVRPLGSGHQAELFAPSETASPSPGHELQATIFGDFTDAAKDPKLRVEVES